MAGVHKLLRGLLHEPFIAISESNRCALFCERAGGSEPHALSTACGERHLALCGASRNTILFRASDATAPFVTRNVELLDWLAPQFEEQMRQCKEEDSFIELVRHAIQDRLTGNWEGMPPSDWRESHRPATAD